jgi:ABC-type Fe3+-hydroxamate transport system substrate-binding protein
MKKFLLFLLFLFNTSFLFSQERIVSLTPSITETIYLLGEQDNVVGITSFCRRISEKQKIVGTYLEPNIEEIVKLRPDIVFISKEGTRKEIVDKIREFGIKVIVLKPANNFTELKQQFLELAKVLNKQEKAKRIIYEYENKLSKLKRNKSKRVLCIISFQPIFVASDKSYIGEIIRYAGGENVIKSEIKYPQVDIEKILELKPEVIILSTMGSTENEIKKFFSQYKEIPAVKNNKIFVIPSNILCQPTINNFYTAVNEVYRILNENK